MLLSPATTSGNLPSAGNWSWGKPAKSKPPSGGGSGGGKKEPEHRPVQQAVARQRLLTLAIDENETIKLLPATFAELQTITRDWLRLPPDAIFALRVPVEYVSIATARLVQGSHIYISDEESYTIATMGVQGLRVEILADTAPPEEEPPEPITEMPGTFNLELAPGKLVALDTLVSSDDLDMARSEDGTIVDGIFWGKLQVTHTAEKHEMEFTGTRIAGDMDIPSDLIFDGRIMQRLTTPSRQMSAKCHLSILVPNSQHCDLFLSFSQMWQVAVTWPPGEAVQGNQTKLKFFLKVHPGGGLEHIESKIAVTSIYYEAVPDVNMVDPYEFVAPRNSFAMPFQDFIYHIFNLLDSLGCSIHVKTEFMHQNLPLFAAHRNIGFRFLSPSKIAAAIDISVSLASCLFTRLFLIFRGVDDEEMIENWAESGEKEANACDWGSRIGISPDFKDMNFNRVLEISVLEVS